MVVVKQCVVLKKITQFHVSVLILIAGISPITSIESENSPLNLINNRISKSLPKPSKNDTDPPTLFPRSSSNKSAVQGIPIVKLNDFLTDNNQAILNKTINKIKRKFGGGITDDSLPRATTVILNDTHDTNYTNLNASTDESANSRNMTSQLHAKSLKLHNNELSKRTTIIFLVSVAAVSLFFYIFLVSFRKVLERKYGDRQLLVQNESRPEDI